MSINTSDSRIKKVAWLNNHQDISSYSKLQLQKFLFFYEMFQFAESKEYDFSSLKAYKNGPVFSNFYGDITYREDEVLDSIKRFSDELDCGDIDEENALTSKFLIETLTDSELSSLSHEFNFWNTHNKEISENIKHIDMKERDITQEDIDLVQLIKIPEPEYNYKIIKIANKRFIVSEEDFSKLSENHLELLDILSVDDELLNPVYIKVDCEGRLLID